MAETAARHVSSKLAAAQWILLGASLAVASVGLRIGVYLFTAAFARDLRYVGGCVEGIGIDLVLGLAVASPILARHRAGTVLAATLSVVLLLANSVGAHFHAMFLSLPTRDALEFLKDLQILQSSIDEHAPLAELLAESTLPAIVSFWIARRLAPRLADVLREPRRLALAFAAMATLTLASLVRASAVYGQEYYGAIGPVTHVTKRRTVSDIGPGVPPPLDIFAAVERALATDNLGPPVDHEYPFCARSVVAPASEKTGRSALLLILESVDVRSLDLVVGGVQVMPNLRRMAKDGVLFSRFFSTGNMSVYSLPALFGGVPAVPERALLLNTPLDNVLGYPSELRREGYDTAFLHAADLTFSHQDEFLKRVGFEKIVPMPPGLSRYGWGASDGAMFDELRAYIERHRADGTKPYFVTAFTVTTHDPYTVPETYKRKFQGTTAFDRFADSLSYLDGELGRFYDWFRQTEIPRGTVLAVTGDHAPRVSFPGDPIETTTGEFEFRFQVPLVLLGLNDEESRRARDNAARVLGGHHDLPATFATALGVPAPRCHQGRSLLSPEVPPIRLVPSVAGDSLQFLYAHEGTHRFMLELRKGRISEYDYVSDPTFRHDLAASSTRALQVKEFLHKYRDVMGYAVVADKLAPPPAEEVKRRAVLPHVAITERVLRALQGSPVDGGIESSLDRALVTRPEWIELSVTTNARGGVVVRPWKDPVPANPESPATTIGDTKAEGPPLDDVLRKIGSGAGVFIDIERQHRFADIMGVVHGTVAAVSGLPRDARVVVESSDEVMLTSVRQFSGVTLAYRLTPEPVTDRALTFAADRGFSWVCLAEEFATSEAVVAAHAHGLRVVTYPRGPSPASGGATELPDARVAD